MTEMDAPRVRLQCRIFDRPIRAAIMENVRATPSPGLPAGWEVQDCLDKNTECYDTGCPFTIEDGDIPPFGEAAGLSSKWVPVVWTDRCTGCGRCVEVCGPRILEILNGAAVLIRPESCGSEEHCIAVCPDEAIRMAWVPLEGDKRVGLWRER